ncbi:hypothetical protein PFX98_13580 [Paucibacter sediminis]|uniref:Surface layer protein n=1 Tax=Paucibacter sediminis TaxID=3019553 RepID=A0AA95SNP7_9BURK|nr:hypothetical protein [Paucibacter sp. S2-9]WIT09966.1 hypothetical protein PFX98_13580 [Paucibacter sp. S2-9]
MKKYVLKATALAIGALVGGVAFAAAPTHITLSDDVADARTYGTELVADGTTLTDVYLATSTKMGFGVSKNAVRFVRFDITNAKWANAVDATNLTAETAAAVALAPQVAVVQGGATTDSYVIFQITAADTNYDQADVFKLALDTIGVKVTSVGTSVDLTYALYETAEKAVANAAATKLAGYNETVAKFGKALNLAITAGANTAGVEKAFKQFTTATAGTFTKTIALGKLNNAVNTRYTKTGGAIGLGDLIDTDSALVVKGDFSAMGSTGKVFLDNADSCGSSTGDADFATGNTSKGTIVVDANAVTNKNVCYTVSGSTAVPAQTVTVAYDIVAKGTATTADVGDTTLGTIAHDGTTLQAPFATIHPDYLSRVVLTSTYGTDAAVAASVITEDGKTCASGTADYNLKAGKLLVINTKDICPSMADGSTRLAVKLDVVAPSSTISGVYNVMNYDQVTGKTNSLISYPLLRPGTN